MKVLIRLYASHRDRRGLGDSIQFIIVLKHIRESHPDWEIYTETTSGKESCYTGFVKHTFSVDDSPAKPEDFEKVFSISFGEPHTGTSDLAVRYQVPATKPTSTLFNDFQITPNSKLFKYEMYVSEQTRRMVKSYLQTLPTKNGIVTIHHRANSSPHNKDIDERDLSKVCDNLIHNGYTPLVLDWKGSGLPDQKRIFMPTRENSIWMGQPNGNASVIAAIIEQSKLFVGIDSGPLHVAGATRTPSIGYWKFHHPVHYYDLSDNVTHMVPCEHLRYMKSNNKNALDDYFQRNYKHKWYHSGDRANSIINTINDVLRIPSVPVPQQINSTILPDFTSIQDRQWWTIKVN